MIHRLILVAAFILPLPMAGVAIAQETASAPVYAVAEQARAKRLDELFAALAAANENEWQVIEDEIWTLWSQSGSPTLDLLLERGREALDAGDTKLAIEHFTALIDHAPDFAEAYNARATAYYIAGLYGPAVEDIRHTLELEPRHFAALAGLGIMLEEIGDNAEALKVFRAVLKIHPHREDVADLIEQLTLDVEGREI